MVVSSTAMRRPSRILATSLLMGTSVHAGALAQSTQDAPPWSFLERHCTTCHSGEDPEAGVDLSESATEPLADDDWRLVVELLREGEMPPRARPRPPRVELQEFLDWAEDAHGLGPAPTQPLDPGRPVLRRLNVREHQNSLRDALGVELDLEAWLPADVIGYGFDNIGETQTLSDDLLERYLELAETVASEAWNAWGPSDVRARHFNADDLSGFSRGEAIVLTTNGVSDAAHEFPCDGPYRLRVCASGQQAGPEVCRMALTVDGVAVAEVEVAEERGAPGIFEAEVSVLAGTHRVGGAFLNDYYRPQAERPEDRDRNLFVHWVELEGPLEFPPPTALQAELLERFPARLGAKRLERTVSELARRLWRRPISSDESRRILRRIDSQLAFEKQVQDSIVLLLLSPQFLFRFEDGGTQEELLRVASQLDLPSGLRPGVVALDGHELATRLSYFLWSSAPDEELRSAASDGSLLDTETLLRETRRMLAHPRARAFARDFAEQWLQLRKLERIPLPEGISLALRSSMIEETLRLFETVLAEDLDLRTLLDADFSFRDPLLAAHYGDTGGDVHGWERVALAAPRRGVVSQASILTLTSEPTRTSPVRRGKWLMETLLNEPPPPPPVDAGSFKNDGLGATAADLREELAQHRARAECAPCHDSMDPLGLALENFGPTGLWRDEDGGAPIDPRAQLADGRPLEGLAGLRELLRDDPAFVRAVTERVFVYALGRPLQRSDSASVTTVIEGLDPSRPTLAGILEGVVTSAPFRLLGSRE